MWSLKLVNIRNGLWLHLTRKKVKFYNIVSSRVQSLYAKEQQIQYVPHHPPECDPGQGVNEDKNSGKVDQFLGG
jgi:hypothetical protein